MEQNPNPSKQQQEQSSLSYLIEKLHDLLDESDTEEETGNPHFQEMVEEVMQELYKEIIAASPSSKVFIDEGKNGSCGASVSDKGSSVMAGIEVVGVAGGVFPVPGNGSEVVVGERNDEIIVFSVGEENNNKEMEEIFDELEKDLDDEWLEKILNWDQQNQFQEVEATQWF